MSEIQVTITDNNASIDVNFAQSLSTNIAVHNTNETSHDNIISGLKAKDAQLTSQVATKAEATSVPTKVSQLQNDSNFATVSQIPTVPTNVSQLTNDASYVNTTQLNTKANITLNNLSQPSALTNLGFLGQLLNQNGYYKFPNGLILQWGYVSATVSTADQTITFPIAFPTACLHVLTQISYESGSGAAYSYFSIRSKSTTQFVAMATISRYWLAIGY